jgi:transposase
MANRLAVTESDTILALFQRGWRKLRIARELRVDVKTVRRHIRLANSLEVPPGSDGSEGANSPVVPLGIPGGGPPSQCEPYRAFIEEELQKGLSAQRIYQDLVTEKGYGGGYCAVKRFVRRLRAKGPERFERQERRPGEEAQVDFGRGARVRDAQGRTQKTWVFRIVLSYSRKAYSEAVLRLTTETLIRCLENAFRSFGGVVKTLVLDNLKAAVKQADWYEPELNPKLLEFARHYGTAIVPIRPRTPEHNGKVERGIGYVKGNALKAREFASLADENAYLWHWEAHVADLRIHGTTREQVARRFEMERACLLPLPPSLFPCFQEGRRRVHRDGSVEVDRAYYEVPEEYVGRDVWVRWDGRTVRVFNDRMEQIAVHARVEKGRFCRAENTTTRGRLLGVEHTASWLQQRAARIGPKCGAWASAVWINRGVEGIRPLYGLLALTRKHRAAEMERACERALTAGAYRLHDVRRLLERTGPSDQQVFLDTHPLIRDLGEYGALLAQLTTPPPFNEQHPQEIPS